MVRVGSGDGRLDGYFCLGRNLGGWVNDWTDVWVDVHIIWGRVRIRIGIWIRIMIGIAQNRIGDMFS